MATILQFPAPIPDPASDVSQYGACLLRVGVAAGAMASIGEDDLAAEMFCRAEMATLSRRIKRAAGRMTAAGVAAVLEASGP